MFSVENAPTRLPPPPRSVTGGLGCGIWGLRLFMLPHMFIGLALIEQFLVSVLTAGFGTDLVAHVTRAYTRESSKGGTIYYIDYQYNAGGRLHTNSVSVGAGAYARVNRREDAETRPATVRVRYFEVGPLNDHVLIEEHSAWSATGTALFIALFWNGIVSVFVYVAWIAPIRSYLLIRNGKVVEGTITSTRERRGKGTTYYAKFRFRHPDNGAEIEREMRLPGKEAFDASTTGRRVTVVYSARNPRHAVIYEFSGNRAHDETPTHNLQHP